MWRNEIIDERDLERKIAGILDDATVALLTVTSPPSVVARVTYEERAGIPVYDDTPGVQPRDELKRCTCCGRRFWGCAQAGGRPRQYCTNACTQRAKHRRDRDRDRDVAHPIEAA